MQLKTEVTKQTICQRLRDEHGLQTSVASLKRYIVANLREEGMRARVTVLRMDQCAWTECHMEASAFYGGVPDNLRTGVDRSELYDPKINCSYGELAAHYGTLRCLAGTSDGSAGEDPVVARLSAIDGRLDEVACRVATLARLVGQLGGV